MVLSTIVQKEGRNPVVSATLLLHAKANQMIR